jgi:ubiquinone/menaquinone biosynthesis C-methylase UbiE
MDTVKTAKLLYRYLLTWIDPHFARVKFALAPKEPAWLDRPAFDSLLVKYPPVSWSKYDDESVCNRGRERADLLKSVLGPDSLKIKDSLEVGCWDAMVSCVLSKMKINTTAIDISSEGFHPDAKAAGVNFLQMDATAMRFEDSSFDLVFSFDAFEHFNDPDRVFAEAIRVLRPGGYLYCSFGPLYFSPFGLHGDSSIVIPYCHVLFPKELLEKCVSEKNLTPIDFNQTNKWMAQRFEKMFSSATGLQKIFYRKIHDARYLDVIAKYPSCFKSKAEDMDEFTVGMVEALFRKKEA